MHDVVHHAAVRARGAQDRRVPRGRDGSPLDRAVGTCYSKTARPVRRPSHAAVEWMSVRTGATRPAWLEGESPNWMSRAGTATGRT